MTKQEILQHDDTFRYRLLSRLQQDCMYYLGYGNRSTNSLWGITEEAHIEHMKLLYDSFAEEAKPEWITPAQIFDYECEMVGVPFCGGRFVHERGAGWIGIAYQSPSIGRTVFVRPDSDHGVVDCNAMMARIRNMDDSQRSALLG